MGNHFNLLRLLACNEALIGPIEKEEI